ncbi:MAG: DinB family protein [Pyrinomonadaceae bacterium]
MTDIKIGKPDDTEYAPYYSRYISLVPDTNILTVLSSQSDDTLALLRGIPESLAGSRYAPDKWSVKELVGHMIDTERIFAYRAMRFARNDKTALPGFEQDDYIANASFDNQPLGELAEEFESVRRSTLFLYKHLDEEAWTRRGVASESEVSVRALAYIIAGHERHHIEILRSRYLQPAQAK